MLPKHATRTITIYPRWTNTLTQLIKPVRRVLYLCSWEDKSAEITLNTGQIVRDSVFIRVFDDTSGLTYLPPHEWNALSESDLDGYWTVDISLTSRPLIVGHETTHEFTAGTSANVTTQENAFRRNTPDAMLVSQVNVNQKKYGSHVRMIVGI